MAYGSRDGFAGVIKRAVWALGAQVSELVAPTYRPELHYMRGPGPATARRSHADQRSDASER